MTVFDAGAGGPVDARRFATSWLLPPPALFAVRATAALYVFVAIFTVLGLSSPARQQHYFAFFTSLSFVGLAFYLAFAALHTGTYWLVGRPLLARWPTALQHLHWFLYSTVTTFPFVVTIVYWGLIHSSQSNKGDSFAWFSDVSQHMLNTAFALFEILLPRTQPTPWLHIPLLILLLLLYVSLAYIAHASAGFWVYTFLDPSRYSAGATVGYIIGVLAGAAVTFTIVHFIVRLRKWVTEKKLGFVGSLSKRDTRSMRAVRPEMLATSDADADVEMARTVEEAGPAREKK